MPNSETTVVASLEQSSSSDAVSKTNTTTNENACPEVYTVYALPNKWEEPHPGQRYLYTLAEDALPVPDACNHCCNGGGKVGMAAKSYALYSSRGSAARARRFARPRFRYPASRLKGFRGEPGSTHSDSSSARFSVHTVDSNITNNTTSTTPTLTACLANSPGFPLSPLPNYGTFPSINDPNPSKRQRLPVRLTLHDVSGYLKVGGPPTPSTITAIHHENCSTVTVNADRSSFVSLNMVDADAASPQQPSPEASALMPQADPYGWDAELQKRLAKHHYDHRHPGPVGGDCCSSAVVGWQNCSRTTSGSSGTSGGKKSLLQKVLSLASGRDFRGVLP